MSAMSMSSVPVSMISGPGTDNEAGRRVIRDLLRVPARNATTQAEALVEEVLEIALGRTVASQSRFRARE